MTCEQCGDTRVHRTHRENPLDRVAGLFRIYPHRCHACNTRFYASSLREKPNRWNGAGLQFIVYSILLVGSLIMLAVYLRIGD